MTVQVIFALGGVALVAVLYGFWQVRKANAEIERLLAQNSQLKEGKAVAEAKVKNFEVRVKNETKSKQIKSSGVDSVIERLQQSGDLRD